MERGEEGQFRIRISPRDLTVATLDHTDAFHRTTYNLKQTCALLLLDCRCSQSQSNFIELAHFYRPQFPLPESNECSPVHINDTDL